MTTPLPSTSRGRGGRRRAPADAYVLVYCHVCALDRLDEEQASYYWQHVLHDIASRAGRYSSITGSSWTQGFYLVFDGVYRAADAALDLRDYFREDWTQRRLPRDFGVSISMTMLPSSDLRHNPLLDRDEAVGGRLRAAAALAPEAGRGQVWASAEVVDRLRSRREQKVRYARAERAAGDDSRRELPFVIRRVTDTGPPPKARLPDFDLVRLYRAEFNGQEFHRRNLEAARSRYTVISTRNSKLFADAHDVKGIPELLARKMKRDPSFRFSVYFIDPEAAKPLREVIVKLMRTFFTRSDESPQELARELSTMIGESIRNAREVYRRLKLNLDAGDYEEAIGHIELLTYAAVPIIPMVIADETIYVGFPVLVWGEAKTRGKDVGFTNGPYLEVLPGSPLFERLEQHERILRSISKRVEVDP